MSFPAGICNDDSDKIELRRRIYEDIYSLRKPTKFFLGEKMITVQVILLVTLQDRKERSQATGFAYHNATLGGRWGWVSKRDELLISCDKCYNHRLKNPSSIKRVENCRSCCDWDHSKVKYNLHKNYPVRTTPQYGRRITFQTMKNASVKAYNNLHSARAKNWTEKSTKEYLKAEGLNEPLIKKIGV